jgi:galactose oxidase
VQILTWSAYSETSYDKLRDRYVRSGGGSGLTKSSIYDPKTGTISAMTISNTQHDMFCPGIASLPNGNVIVTGGQNADRVSVYDSASNSWKTAPTMGISRGYGSTVTLSDGKVRACTLKVHCTSCYPCNGQLLTDNGSETKKICCQGTHCKL